MLHDSVLRCLIAIRHGGQVYQRVYDAVREGDNFLIVLEWGSPDENKLGLAPKLCVPIPSSEIEAEADPTKDYEIVSHMGIDFDSATVSEVEGVTKKLFRPSPTE